MKRHSRNRFRLQLEQLEERLTPSTVAFGDFNGDGFRDMAVANPTASVGNLVKAGTINIFYGSAAGYDTQNKQTLTMNDAGDVNNPARAGAQFGFAIAAGNFNGAVSSSGHRIDSLLVGSPFATVQTLANAGLFVIFNGSSTGLDTSSAQVWWQGKNGSPHRPAMGDKMGYDVAAGDFNGDGCDDAVIGSPGNSPNPAPTFLDAHEAGSSFVYYGSAQGVTAVNSHTWDESTNGIKGECIPFQHLGNALAVGDFNNDGFADYAVGIADYQGGAAKNIPSVGAVLVLYGSPSGITATGSQLFAMPSSGIANNTGAGTTPAAANAQFGYSLATGDFNGDGRSDLAIGIVGQTVDGLANAGAVTVLFGSPAGLTGSGGQTWTQTSVANGGVAQANARFGSVLGAGDFNGDGKDDLAIGVPNQTVNGLVNAGIVNVVYGSSAGLSAVLSQRWAQGNINIGQSAQANALFGSALAANAGDPFAALAITAPGQTSNSLGNLGAVNLMPGSLNGLTDSGNRFLNPGPAAPAKLVGVGKSGTSIEVRWVNVAGPESSIAIQRSTDGINYTPIATVNPGSTSFLDTGLSPQTQYSYRVRAVNAAGNSQWTSTLTSTSGPAAPTGLAGAVTAAAQVTLIWSDNSNNEGGFAIQRSRDGITWTALVSVPLNTTTYVDNTVMVGGPYYYRVQGVNGAGKSSWSNTLVQTVAPPPAPSNLLASVLSRIAVALSWLDNSTNETSFKIFYSLNKITWIRAAIVGSNVTGYTVTGLTANTLYYFKVLASNGAGNSSYTNTVSATTAP